MSAALALSSMTNVAGFVAASRASSMARPTAMATTAAFLLPRGGSAKTSSTVRSASTTATAEEMSTNADGTCSTTAAYQELVELLEGITHLGRASAVLGYDQMVFMPQTDSASNERGKQSAALAAVIHEKSVDPRIGELLTQLESATDVSLSSDQQRVAELARKAYDKKVKIPTSLASKAASLSAQAYNIWAKARAADDFSQFQDILGEGIDVAKQSAAAIQTPDEIAAQKSLYATMLDEFEVGMDPDRIDAIFEEIQSALVPLIDLVLSDKATPPNTSLLNGKFPIPAQEAMCKDLVRAIGFDDSQGRIDVSVHPFSSSMSKHDCRITSRFKEEEWYQGLAGSLHEAGHAMYEQNMGGDEVTNALPIDAALSMGMHESQSLFWERHIGMSKSFWQYAAPIVNGHLKTSHSAEDLYAAVNNAQRSLIRVEADELTYPLHVILRYTIERDFIESRLDVANIPTRWNKGMKDMLNIDVPSDAKGCLQDVHWSMLAYGYFPTYLIGAATAAQWAHYCQKDIKDFDKKVAAGDFTEIKEWMTEKVHKHGSRYKSLDEHLKAQVGEELNPKYFIDYLTQKYKELYQC